MRYYEDFALNQPKTSREVVIDQEKSIEFAKEWDPQPFHIDEELAKQWPLGLTASGLYTIAFAVKLCNEVSTEPSAVVAGLGWDEVRLPNPVAPGDRLHVKIWVESKRESRSKPDMGIITNQVQVWNQDGNLVLSYKISCMMMKRPLEEGVGGDREPVF